MSQISSRNIRIGAPVMARPESSGKVAHDLLAKLITILEVTPDEVRRSTAEDYRQWLSWANEPIRPYLVAKLMACVYRWIEPPDDALSTEAATDYAAKLARKSKKMVWLILLRRISIRFGATGKADLPLEAKLDMPCEPYLVIGGKPMTFDLTWGSDLCEIEGPSR